jgi:hypothetical protein
MLSQIETADRGVESSHDEKHLVGRLAPFLSRLEKVHRPQPLVPGQKQIHHRRRREACAVVFPSLLPIPAIGERTEFRPRKIPKLVIAQA